MIVYANGAKNPSEVKVASPTTVVNVVERIGLSLDLALSLIASALACQSFIFSFALSIRIIALFTTIPTKAINPIININEYGCPVKSIQKLPPTNPIKIL